MSENADNLIADLVKPGVLVCYYMSDASTARARYRHDGARPVILEVQDTLRAEREAGSLIQVNSIDAERDQAMDIFISAGHVIAVRIEKAADMLGAAS
jgi:hypothetical protein